MESHHFFCQVDHAENFSEVIDGFCRIADRLEQQTYVLQKPLSEEGEEYSHNDYLVYLSSKKKILIFDFSGNDELAEEVRSEFIEDLIAYSKRFKYNKIIGRSSSWGDLVEIVTAKKSEADEAFLLESIQGAILRDPAEIKKCDLLISLLTGSINDIEKVKADIPENNLDKVKQKIMLFDRDQTRFIYSRPEKKVIRIQGLSGTGKTELLLHKLKELYVKDADSKIYFTCHSRILASTLRNRVPEFFNFMKVDEQIQWEKRLWCTHAWGSASAPSTGIYAYICSTYNIPFYNFQQVPNINYAAKLALDHLIKKYGEEKSIPPLFDYVMIDESQDFGEDFFKLCELITAKHLYVAGDIFQSIFDSSRAQAAGSDYLLSKCYRTDPRTLMAAHGIGMGLFEHTKLQWLEDEEWKDCGYIFNKTPTQIKDIHQYTLSRKPLRRFEDIENKDSLVLIAEDPAGPLENIVNALKEIREENPTVTPDDIGVVILKDAKAVALLSDRLQRAIYELWGWNVNKAYESKVKIKNSLFISNKNHVKGLEFPFVVCVSDINSTSLNLRNSLYMVLTRSFLKSYLVVNEARNQEALRQIQHGIENIRNHDVIVTIEPSAAEKERIRTRILRNAKKLSYMDTFNELLEHLEVTDPQHRQKLWSIATSLQYEERYASSDIEEFREDLRQFLTSNLRFVGKV
ncbi:ATP-binding domain-containing protein [Pseudomonas alcaligenes]|uniref:DEAD/DEAH box helicase n=1 Tax=Aquipseudomonas alcaligenes TaxID=43263 RepID=UPI002E7BD877|nr:ATP-binding domain-containing protein [Pseudomonas alcaligenes]MEE1947983.1 ATP-binding domain-containing protein [Pseudomonas alcaligenes]